MKNRKAFTLIETMVVIAIIAILAALLIPAYQAAKRNAAINKAPIEIVVKDFVYLYTTPTTTITGRVSKVWRSIDGVTVDLIVMGDKGNPYQMDKVPIELLTKVPEPLENWK